MPHLHEADIQKLELKANDVRRSVMRALHKAGSGHSAGPLGMSDLFTYTYFHALKHDPLRPDWPDRDRVVLSNGHICPVLYAAMAHAGYFPVEELESTLRVFGGHFQGHPHREFLSMLETSSGPLGSGLSQAVGMAIAERMDAGRSSRKRIYAFLSDGELDTGNIWEGAMLAGKERLGNLIAIVDRNSIQIDGYTEDIMPLEPLADKWRAWNWHVVEVDGHSFADIDRGFGEALAVIAQPTVIIAHTIPGKGVSFMERKYEWHGKTPNDEEFVRAMAELEAERGKIMAHK